VTTPSDRELWERAGSGDETAFGELFDRHAKRIYNFCFRRTGDWAAAEDLLATTFMNAWRRRDQVRLSGDSLLPWLYGVASNLTARHLRGLRRRQAGLARLRCEREPDDDEARVEDEVRLRELRDRLERLSRRERDVIVLCIWQGLSYAEAAVALGVPIGTVRSRLSRARRHLLEPESPGGDERGETTFRDQRESEAR
jgi:RNA polymerase sigma-70 factor, ECF subfamily